MTRNPNPKRTNEFDVTLAEKIALERQKKGLSIKKLSDRIGVSFQQMQKYENATNRVSCQRLNEIANSLDIHVGTFFDYEQELDRLIEDDEYKQSVRLLREFSKIEDYSVRDGFIELVRAIVQEK